MSEMGRELLHNCAALCKIDCSEEEFGTLREDLHSILHYFDRLKEVDTTHVRACTHVNEPLSNVVRKDEASERLSRETFLENSPSSVGGMISVPPVIDN